MDTKIATELWTKLLELSFNQQLSIGAFAATLVGIGFAVGKWSTQHTSASTDAENTILKSKNEALEIEIKELPYLRSENKALNEKVSLPSVSELAYRDGLYYTSTTAMAGAVLRQQNNGPFCPVCWEVNRLQVSLHKRPYNWVCVNQPCEFSQEHTKKNISPPAKRPR